MGQVINLRDYVDSWKETFSAHRENSSMQVWIDEKTGEADIVHSNNYGESITMRLDSKAREWLISALITSQNKIIQG